MGDNSLLEDLVLQRVYHTAGVFIQYNLVSRVKSHVRLQLSEQLLCAAHKSSSNFSDRTCLAAFHGRLLISESSGSLVSFFGKLDIWFGQEGRLAGD